MHINSMLFPENIGKLIVESKDAVAKLLDFVLISGEDRRVDNNLIGWSLVKVGPKLIEVDLEFERPNEISVDGIIDFLLVEVKLSDFKDEYGQSLPASVLLRKDLPPQISQVEAELLDDLGSSAAYGILAALGAYVIVANA